MFLTKLLILDFLLAPLFLCKTFFLTALSIKLKALLRLVLINSSLNRAYSLIDKAVKKNVLHKNNGANKKSRINNLVKNTLKS